MPTCAVCLASLLLTACSGSSATVDAASGEAGGSDSAVDPCSGLGAPKPIGGDRPVDVFVPSGYVATKPTPLVILLHGYSASGIAQESYFKLQPLAEERGFLYAHPDGKKNANNAQFWNATAACCAFGDPATADDSKYLQGIVDEIKRSYCVDPKRVYFVGHSNGGFMSHRMACDHADTIAAIASLAGAQHNDPTLCTPSGPVAALQIHGTADTTIQYNGGSIVTPYPGAVATMERWVTLDGCAGTPDTSAPALDLDSNLAGTETTVQRWTSCMPGGHAELWTIANGGHIPALTAQFAPAVIDFLLAHPKP